MGGEYGSIIIICPLCGESLSVLPKVHHISINQYEHQIENSHLEIQWRASVAYHHCKEPEV